MKASSAAHRFVIFLRGINVGGKNLISMKELSNVLTKFDFKVMATYIQSGNLVVQHTECNAERLAMKMTGVILEHFQNDVPVLALSESRYKTLINSNPWVEKFGKSNEFLHVTFPLRSIDFDPSEDPVNQGSDSFVAKDGIFWLHCPGGYGKTKLNNSFFEKQTQSPCTTRNWRTILTMHSLLVRQLA